MKVCERCKTEIFTKDGENLCKKCDELDAKEKDRAASRWIRQQRKERDEIMKSLGLKKVKGALGGTYYE